MFKYKVTNPFKNPLLVYLIVKMHHVKIFRAYYTCEKHNTCQNLNHETVLKAKLESWFYNSFDEIHTLFNKVKYPMV